MYRSTYRPRLSSLALPAASLLIALALTSVGCGGGSTAGGVGPEGAGQGLLLVNFEQASVDNVPLNQPLRFWFSEALDPDSVKAVSVQIRSGPEFGFSVPGDLRVSGDLVTFEPTLPGLCDYSDAGLQAHTDYRVSLIGAPEAFAIRNSVGEPLEATVTYEFSTRDTELFRDADPGEEPVPLSITPGDGDAEVSVFQGNKIVIEFSENLDPCSIDESTVLFHMLEVGHINDGFVPVEDNSDDPLTWGSTNVVLQITPPQRIPSTMVLDQIYVSDQNVAPTRLTITPDFGEFPENAMLLLQLTSGITDFGGTPLTYKAVSFTTENQPEQTGELAIEYDETTPMDASGTTADVDTNRSPGVAQGFLLFSGDGDNGTDPYSPSLPNAMPGCTVPLQVNNGDLDDFLPGGDTLLNTGATLNTCPNTADGSTAVVWEFKTFRIPSGVTVRVTGVNPAIFLVQDEVVIESGGRLFVRADGMNGALQGRGGGGTATSASGTVGGKGAAGGGNGGDGPAYTSGGSGRYGGNGYQGYLTDASGMPEASVYASSGVGGGEGNTSGLWNTQALCNRNVPSGGGGGHGSAGISGTSHGSGASPVSIDLPFRGAGGGTYGGDDLMPRAEGGSGGGAGGELRSAYTSSTGAPPARGPGGAGGAGGGFVDLTCSGNIEIYGTIDAAGSAGGKGAGNPFNPNYTYNPGTGGGGGGSGGGIRLLTAQDIVLGPGAVLTAAGGAGGNGGTNQGVAQPPNNGGNGGLGRIVLEDGDSVIPGLGTASVTPGEGADGFYRGPFDPTRFSGGGLSTQALTQPILAGPIPIPGDSPAYTDMTVTDFVAGIPGTGSRGQNATGILIEARGWQMTSEGTVDEGLGATTWVTVGFFEDSGAAAAPTWKQSAIHGIPGDVPMPLDNPGTHVNMNFLNGYAYLQVRVTFYLPPTASPLSQGPYVDRITVPFTYDQ